MMDSRHHRMLELLAALERRLRDLGLWSEERPSAAALSSTLPFCYDTLEIEAWLQFIFIGRMHELLEQNDALPTSCAIYPYLEMLNANGRKVDVELARIVETIDATITVSEPLHG